MELILPKNYVDVTEKEMMYLDGGGFGKHWWNSRGTIAQVIDVPAIAIAGWGAICSANNIRKILKSNIGKRLTSGIASAVTRQLGSPAGRSVRYAINLGLVVLNRSIGGIAAYGLDVVDGRKDGYIFA